MMLKLFYFQLLISVSAKLGDFYKCVSGVSSQDNAVFAYEVCSSEGVFSEEEKFGHVLTSAFVIQILFTTIAHRQHFIIVFSN